MKPNIHYGSDEKKLVLARLSVLPADMGIAIGGVGNYSVEDMKEHVSDEDEIGQLYVDMQLEFLRSFKTGTLFE